MDINKYWHKDSVERRIDRAASRRRKSKILDAIAEEREHINGEDDRTIKAERLKDYDESEFLRTKIHNTDTLELITLELKKRETEKNKKGNS